MYSFQQELKKREEGTIKLGLERIQELIGSLNNPQKGYPSILIAGTNGKGSVLAMLESVLLEHGLHVGSYTSPHLVSLNERIRMQQMPLSDADLEKAFLEIQPFLNDCSHFELLTAMAFVAFKQQKVDVALLEVGLGGRLDATNVVTPLVSVITNISLEHTETLGKTTALIAKEKAGIIKPKIPVVTGASDEALAVIQNTANANACRFIVADKSKFTTNLKGIHQLQNVAIVEKTINCIPWKITQATIKRALQKVVWPCRMQYLASDLICDAAHNLAGMKTLIEYLQSQNPPYHVIAAFSSDKDIDEMMFLLQEISDKIVYVPFSWHRSWDPDKYVVRLRDEDQILPSVKEAIAIAKETQGAWLITGSLFLLGEALQELGVSSEDLFYRESKAYKGTLNWRIHD